MPIFKTVEDNQKENHVEDNQKERSSKKRNRDALSPPPCDAHKGSSKKHLKLSKQNGKLSKENEGKVSKLLKFFENENEADIKPKQLTRLFSGFEIKKNENDLIGEDKSPSEVKTNGRGGKQSPLN